jgi:transposase
MGGLRLRGKDRGQDWAERKLRWSVELLKHPHKPAAKSLLVSWAERWSHKGVVDWEKPLPPKEFVVLPRRWVVERTFVLISHNRKMS